MFCHRLHYARFEVSESEVPVREYFYFLWDVYRVKSQHCDLRYGGIFRLVGAKKVKRIWLRPKM